MPSRVIQSELRKQMLRKDKVLRRELTAGFESLGRLMKQEHDAVVRDWSHRPRFTVGVSVTPAQLMVGVFPYPLNARNSKIWRYVDEGTKPHVIRPRTRGGKLKFRTGYEARTAPVAKYGQGRGASGGDWVTAEVVHHPGTEAREFTKTIQDEARPAFVRLIENAFRRAMRGS